MRCRRASAASLAPPSAGPCPPAPAGGPAAAALTGAPRALSRRSSAPRAAAPRSPRHPEWRAGRRSARPRPARPARAWESARARATAGRLLLAPLAVLRRGRTATAPGRRGAQPSSSATRAPDGREFHEFVRRFDRAVGETPPRKAAPGASTPATAPGMARMTAHAKDPASGASESGSVIPHLPLEAAMVLGARQSAAACALQPGPRSPRGCTVPAGM